METLSLTGLRSALREFYGGRLPGYYTIHRAMKAGMPHFNDPLYKHPRFVLVEVVAWLKVGRTTSRIESEARAKAYARAS